MSTGNPSGEIKIDHQYFIDTWKLTDVEAEQIRKQPLSYLLEIDGLLFMEMNCLLDEHFATEMRYAHPSYGDRQLMECVLDGTGVHALKNFAEDRRIMTQILRYMNYCDRRELYS